MTSRARRERGQAAAEFGLVVVILFLMMMGIVDFGRLVAMQSAAVTASREAARYGSAVGGSPVNYMNCDGIRSAAQQIIKPLVTLEASRVLVWYDSGIGETVWSDTDLASGGPGHAWACGERSETDIQSANRVVVRVQATFEPISPLVRLVVAPINIDSLDRRMIIK
jgi:Flp pilus assembly protein TadG